jgi:hypothetical protein
MIDAAMSLSSFHMLWTCVSDLDDFVRDAVLTVCRASIDAVDVVDAAADGIFLDDSHAHDC